VHIDRAAKGGRTPHWRPRGRGRRDGLNRDLNEDAGCRCRCGVPGLRRATPSGQLLPEGCAERARRCGSQGRLKSVKSR
jgi:hypothetical protein